MTVVPRPGDAGGDTVADLLDRADDAQVRGDAVVACDLAQEAYDLVVAAQAWSLVPPAAGLLGHVSALTGQIDRAERAYLAAAECQRGLVHQDVHLHGRAGARWGWYLRRTYRWDDAREVLERNVAYSTATDRPADVALAGLELAALELDKKLAGAALLRLAKVVPELDAAGEVADATRARLLEARALHARGRLDDATARLDDVLAACDAYGLVTTRLEALVARCHLRLTIDGTSRPADDHAQAALAGARERSLVWVQIDALWALAAADDLSRTLRGEDPDPPGSMPRPGSFADQAARLRQSLGNQWFDLHPLRTVERRVGR